MAATFGAATRVPFAAIVFVFELTRDYDAILPLMGATVLADMVARALLTESLMTEKLARRRVTVPGEFRPDVMTTTPVRELMTRDVVTLPATTSVRDALDRFLSGRHSAYPVVDDTDRCVGIVTRSDLLAVGEDEPRSLSDCFAADLVSVDPDDVALTVLQRMLDSEVDHVPVLRDGRLVGICTRTDLLRARHRVAAAEQRQPGWLARLRVGAG
jgi:CBS domain-containing protein